MYILFLKMSLLIRLARKSTRNLSIKSINGSRDYHLICPSDVECSGDHSCMSSPCTIIALNESRENAPLPFQEQGHFFLFS